LGWAPQTGNKVVDRNGVWFKLAGEIGHGGEGIVFATEAEGAAVKIITSQNAVLRRPELEQQLKRVARLALDDLPVAMPRQLLDGDVVGYTMNLLTGMTTLGSLTLPSLTSPFDELWYRESGGLSKRLSVIETLGELIAGLHGRGLVYGDLSANNVLISESNDRSRVFLIDLDNLRLSSDPKRKIWTPDYSAPEQADDGASQQTDLFSLAIIAFSVLCGNNPHYGETLDSLSPDQYQDSPFSSLVPWVDDMLDDSNRWTSGIDRSLVISPLLDRLLHRTFSDGRYKPDVRPSGSSFSVAARRARYAVAKCQNCDWENYINAGNCASCGTKVQSRIIRLSVLRDGSAYPHEICPVVTLPATGGVSVSAAALGLNSRSDLEGVFIDSRRDILRLRIRHKDLKILGGKDVQSADITSDKPVVIERRTGESILFNVEEFGGSV